jgi:hypothetical protein
LCEEFVIFAVAEARSLPIEGCAIIIATWGSMTADGVTTADGVILTAHG